MLICCFENLNLYNILFEFEFGVINLHFTINEVVRKTTHANPSPEP